MAKAGSLPPNAALDRALGPIDAAALLVSNVIGVGIFTTPGMVAEMVPHPWAILGVWLAGGVLAFAGAVAYAELASLRPRSGGEYVYLREAFGPVAGFMTGWISFVAGFAGAIAAGAVALAEYLGHFIPAAADSHPFLSFSIYFGTLSISRRELVALIVIFVLSGVHICGLRTGRLVQNTLTGLLVIGLLVFIICGFSFGVGSTKNLEPFGSGSGASNWLLALVPVMFTYSGWNAATYVAEELRDPLRNLPRSLLLGTVGVVGIYLLLNSLYLYALPSNQLAGIIRVGDVTGRALFGDRAAGVIAGLILLSLAGGLSAWIIAGPRVYYAMAQDGVFLQSAAWVHPRFHTPAVAILAQAIWSGVLVLSGTFEQLLLYTGFAVLLFSGAAVLALFVLRQTQRNRARTFKAWGYPIVPGLFVMASFAMVVNVFIKSPRSTGAGFLIMLAGLPVYFWSKKRNRLRGVMDGQMK